MASMKPGTASWLTVTSPVEGFVETTLPRILKMLYEESAAAWSSGLGPVWHPASRVMARIEQLRSRRITL
jgi:hypothetical protein